MKQLEENIELNNLPKEKHFSLTKSVRQALKSFIEKNKLFDCIVCDPPSFSSDGHKKSSILKEYETIIPLMIELLNKNGRLYLFLNTHKTTWNIFEGKIKTILKPFSDIVIEKRMNLGEDCRRLRGFPEGDYLKGLSIIKK